MVAVCKGLKHGLCSRVNDSALFLCFTSILVPANFMPSLVGETKFPQQNVNPLKVGNSDYSRVFPQHITQYLQENQH